MKSFKIKDLMVAIQPPETLLAEYDELGFNHEYMITCQAPSGRPCDPPSEEPCDDPSEDLGGGDEEPFQDSSLITDRNGLEDLKNAIARMQQEKQAAAVFA